MKNLLEVLVVSLALTEIPVPVRMTLPVMEQIMTALPVMTVLILP